MATKLVLEKKADKSYVNSVIIIDRKDNLLEPYFVNIGFTAIPTKKQQEKISVFIDKLRKQIIQFNKNI